MIRRFRHRGLKRFYEKGDKSGINPSFTDKLSDILAHLEIADKPEDMDLPGFRLHPLKGDMVGVWSVTVSANWRVIFCFEDGDVTDVDFVDYH